MGGNFHLKLNIGSRPIANKYREGKVKRTLERGLKVSEIAKREANEASAVAARLLLGKRSVFPEHRKGLGGSLSWTSRVLLVVNGQRQLGLW